MDVGSAMQQGIIDRAAAYGALIWVVLAICAGLYASEVKKRRFWVWVVLSLATGPVAWYLILVRLGVAVPAHLRMNCPHCGKIVRSDEKRCRYCRRPTHPESKDRAGELGRQAATMVFTAKTLMGRARRVADDAAKKRGTSNGRSDTSRKR